MECQDVMKNIVTMLFSHQVKIKMLHFQTSFYGVHKASDEYLSKFSDEFDKFCEVVQSIQPKFDFQNLKLDIDIPNDMNIVNELENYIKNLKNVQKYFSKYSEVNNIVDEMLGNARNFKYLLSFK